MKIIDDIMRERNREEEKKTEILYSTYVADLGEPGLVEQLPGTTKSGERSVILVIIIVFLLL